MNAFLTVRPAKSGSFSVAAGMVKASARRPFGLTARPGLGLAGAGVSGSSAFGGLLAAIRLTTLGPTEAPRVVVESRPLIAGSLPPSPSPSAGVLLPPPLLGV